MRVLRARAVPGNGILRYRCFRWTQTAKDFNLTVFLAVLGTSVFFGTFLLVMKYDGADFRCFRYSKIWQYFSPCTKI